MAHELPERRIAYSLRQYGFPMFFPYKEGRHRRIPLEDLIIRILENSTDARFIYGIPVMIAKNKINYIALLNKANSKRIQNRLGWIIEEILNSFKSVGIEKDRSRLKGLIRKIKKTDSEHYVSLDPEIESDRVYGLALRSDIARRWNILTAYDTSDFVRILRIYINGKKENLLQGSNRNTKRIR